MEKFHIGSGVYRATANTMLYEVYTPEQMEAMASGEDLYKWMQKKGLKGGFSGIKVVGKPNVHKRMVFENMDLITAEQRDVINTAMNSVAPPQVEYVGEVAVGMRHDLSKNADLAVEDNIGEISSGTNVPETDAEKEFFDESFMGEADVKPDGYRENGSEGSEEDGGAVKSDERPKPSAKAGNNRKPNKKPSAKNTTASK